METEGWAPGTPGLGVRGNHDAQPIEWQPVKGGTVKSDPLTRIALVVIAASLAVLALQPLLAPRPVHAGAQDSGPYPLFVEPGTTSVKAPDGSSQFTGKVMIDMRNGNIWGYPTQSPVPYPVDATKATPPVSHPIYLGRFDLAATAR